MRNYLVIYLIILYVSGCAYMQPNPRLRSNQLPIPDNRRESTEDVAPDSSLLDNQVVNTENKNEPVNNLEYLNITETSSNDAIESRNYNNTSEETEIIYPTSTYLMSQDDVRALALMIRDFLGTPYVWGGSSLQGTDCSGFVSTVFRDVLGLQLPRSAAQMYNVGEPVQNGPLQFADLLFFRQSPNSKITHVGIYIAQKKFVHASPTRGVMISGLDEKFHREHFVGAKRIVGRAPYDQE